MTNSGFYKRSLPFYAAASSTMRFAQFFSFQGRLSRQGFWLEYGILYLLTFLMALVLLIVTGGKIEVVNPVVTLALFVPYLSVTARRLHDLDLSGWFQMWWVGLTAVAFLGGTPLTFLLGIPAAFLVGASLLALGLHALYTLGLRPGRAENNRFGAPNDGAVFSFLRKD